MARSQTEQAPAEPAGPAPLRRPCSIRRTSSIDTDWPEGFGTPMHMRGRARDLVTPREVDRPQVIADDELEIGASVQREVLSIWVSRGNDRAQALVGLDRGGSLRKSIAAVFLEEIREATPLHLLLDDYAGASLVANWAWTRWIPDAYQRRKETGVITAGRKGRMVGVCSGFRPGSSSLNSDGSVNPTVQRSTRVVPLQNPSDPWGWHPLLEQQGVGMRRARRMDVWVDDRIWIDVGFQDSATSPEGGRIAVHEYSVRASASAESCELMSLEARAHVLPYRECPEAVNNIGRVVGRRLGEFRSEVPTVLPGVLGCTHLNDVLRSLSDVPALVRGLRAAGV